ncbi:MAG: hypothetical protein H0T73_12720 [Ardenticatenales bacterium]|nr:hypothetical protein [Ardenticatenales bacterium]
MFLRHDIDFSVRKAVEMAELDSQAGARATFFVLLTAPYYNALSQDNLALLRTIAGMGHEIGLHYDCTGFEELGSTARQQRIALLANCLADGLGQAVTSIAQHKPASAGVRETFAQFRDAYNPRFCSKDGYLSDSRKRFGVDDVYGFFRANPRSQLLIHPVWWHESARDRDGALGAIQEEASTYMAEFIREETSSLTRYFQARS